MVLTDRNDNKPRQEGKTSMSYFVLPEQVEEEARIAKIEFYKSTIPQFIIFFTTIVLSAGLFALLSKWKKSFYVRIRYVKGTARNADYLVIHCIDGTIDYAEVHKKSMYIDGATRIYRVFSYRLYKYYHDQVTNQFKPIEFVIKNKTFAQIHKEMSKGFQTEEAYQQRLSNYGRNSTDLPEKSSIEIIVDELLSPFHLFQLFAIIFWGFFNDYEVYAVFIFVVSLITLTINFFKVKSNHRKLRQKASFETSVSVFRTPEEIAMRKETIVKMIPKTMSSTWLVPGDLIEIPNDQKMPCDIILINGTCVMNEGMLTGASIPVIKQQLPNSDKLFDSTSPSFDQYILFSGTECLETRKTNPDMPVLGIVLRTGFGTMKGRLIRSFLYSKPENFQFYKDSLKYIGAMAIIALICFILSVVSFLDQEQTTSYIIVKSLDIITIAVPPALPTVVAIGSILASIRLEKRKILTKSEMKINVAGKVKFMCFDKTGTLTRDSMDLYGVRSLLQRGDQAPEFAPIIADNIHQTLDPTPTTEKNLNHKMLELMATCHSLTYVKKNLSGDPLDVKMFQATGWRYSENFGSASFDFRLATLAPPLEILEPGYFLLKSEVIILKRFEFSPELQRMSVIIKDKIEGKQRVYAKGSPEMIISLCRPETIPDDYDKVLLSYVKSGLRVIACATKVLEKNVATNDDLPREPFESDLEFMGFIVFENKLKEVTRSIIKKLNDADIKIMMLTGDNPLTSIFVGRDCGILEQNQRVILGTLLAPEDDTESKSIEWKFIDPVTFEDNKPEETPPISMISPQKHIEIEMIPQKKATFQRQKTRYGDVIHQEEIIDMLQKDPTLAVAMTAEAFNFFDSSSDTSFSMRDLVLKRSKILARMPPEDRAVIVEKIQKQGYTVGMCGDGANDCPALKAADVGVSLSEAEASLAAPFMSKILDISCVDILLREGRAALVTSFQCFKFMSMYSLIQAFTVVILYSRASAMTNPCFIYQDLFMIIPAAFTMSLTLPTSKLSKEEPTGTLLSFPVLSSMLGHCLIQAAIQYVAGIILEAQDWYESPTELLEKAIEETGDEDATAHDYNITVLFLVGNIQYFATVMAFSIGEPFRKPFYKNILFTISVVVNLVVSIIFILVPMPNVYDSLEIKDFPEQKFKWIVFAIVVVNTFITLAYEKFVVPLLSALRNKVFQRRKLNKGIRYAAKE